MQLLDIVNKDAAFAVVNLIIPRSRRTVVVTYSTSQSRVRLRT